MDGSANISNLVAQIDNGSMVLAIAHRIIGLSVYQVQISGSQRCYDPTVHGLGYDLILLAGIRLILLISFAHCLDALKARLHIRSADASRNESTAYLAQLFLIHERAAGCHNIIFGSVLDGGTFSSRGLFT